ncbi:hypothetical protein HKX48_005425 [Thoreauomyces humboldtii]|nr:hypothetical protein HKX48_005425 [Thoreauomyces humboldtii]
MTTPTLDIYTLAPLIIDDFDGAELKDGKYQGDGTAFFSSGNTYQGPFPRGYMEGTGSYVWKDGVRYQGEFKGNKITGRGTYTWKDGCKYEGQLLNGLRHGNGIMFCEPVLEAWYDGEWKDGRVCGQGKLTYDANGSSHYDGTWLDGLKHGRGIMSYASGNVYDGEWARNVKEGKGVMHWLDRGESYQGEWKNGQPSGFGVYTWTIPNSKPHQYPLSNSYTGHWENGRRNGHGVFQYANGARYTGEWKDNCKSGKGSYVSENGRQYVGEWIRDRPAKRLAPYENDRPYTLRIEDLLRAGTSAENDSEEVQLQQINDVVLRYITELRSIYSYYTQPAPDSGADGPAIMSQVDLCRFMKDCGVLDKQITLADCNRLYAQQYRDDQCYQHVYQSPHAPGTTFVLYDFLSYMLRVSYLLYAGQSDLSLFDRGLSAGFSTFIKEDVLRKVELAMTDDEAAALAKELSENSAAEYAHRIYTIYRQKAQSRPNRSLPGSKGDVTMTMREVLLMLSEYGLLSKEANGPLTVSKVIQIFAAGGAQVENGGSYNLEYEMVPHEVYEAVYAAICLIHANYYERTVLPIALGLERSEEASQGSGGASTPASAVATAAPASGTDSVGGPGERSGTPGPTDSVSKEKEKDLPRPASSGRNAKEKEKDGDKVGDGRSSLAKKQPPHPKSLLRLDKDSEPLQAPVHSVTTKSTKEASVVAAPAAQTAISPASPHEDGTEALDSDGDGIAGPPDPSDPVGDSETGPTDELREPEVIEIEEEEDKRK